MEIEFLEAAERDLAEIKAYIAEYDAAAATTLLATIRDKIKPLGNHSQMGRPGRVKGTRELIVHKSYIVVYRIGDTKVQILAVWHSRRKWPENFP